MPKAQLQLHGEDRVLCRDRVAERWPHGRGYPCQLTKHTWIVRAHRGTILKYGTEKTDCQFIKVTHTKKAGQPWRKREVALSLDNSPGQDGRRHLRAAVPHGPLKGNHGWARIIVWLWHRPAGMTAMQFKALDDDGQHRVQANHLNRNPHVTLVDELEACDPDENHAHYRYSGTGSPPSPSLCLSALSNGIIPQWGARSEGACFVHPCSKTTTPLPYTPQNHQTSNNDKSEGESVSSVPQASTFFALQEEASTQCLSSR